MAEYPQTPRIFLDSSVVFSSATSTTGASRALILLGEIGFLQLVVSEQVFYEAERNLRDKAPSAIAAFERFRKSIPWSVAPYPTSEQVAEAAKHIASKDAPILAAAMNVRVDRLITLDVRHFKTEEVFQYSKLIIQTPGELVLEIRNVLASRLSAKP